MDSKSYIIQYRRPPHAIAALMQAKTITVTSPAILIDPRHLALLKCSKHIDLSIV